MPRRNRGRSDQQRSAVADEAARIMQEQGISNFRDAKAKAGHRLGLEDRGVLPTNEEIERALAERHRVFHGDAHDELIVELRSAALALMRQLPEFDPRLTGPVLAGTATEHQRIDLHLFSDSPEAVGGALAALGVAARPIQHRLRTRRDDSELFPGYRFSYPRGEADYDCCVMVFRERGRGNAPLSAVDGRPMKRASTRDVEALLPEGEPGTDR